MKYNRTFQALAIPIVNVYDHLKYNYHVIGREKVPDGGCVLVANHTQWADPVLVGTALGNQYPLVAMAKKELFQIKLLGPLISALGAFPVDRGTADIGAIKTSLKAVKEGKKLLIFPEGGTKHKAGDEAKVGAAMIAARTGAPIVPIYISEISLKGLCGFRRCVYTGKNQVQRRLSRDCGRYDAPHLRAEGDDITW